MKNIYLLTLLCFFVLTGCKEEKIESVATEIEAIENGLLPPIVEKGKPVTTYSIEDRMAHYNVPGVSIAVVENGEIQWAKGYGIANTETGDKVDANTLFQAGSISKPLAALSALKLVEEGKLALDNDVNNYLTDWKVPESPFTETEKVTLRRLLTHSAGMTVHGFPGYKQKDSFPTITQVLNGEGNTDKILVDTIPGSIWRYSGGGYTVMEKMVEDVSGMPLDEYMEREILKPLGLESSTYKQPLGKSSQENVSAAYDGDGQLIEGLWNNYPEQAAAGLWTTPTDLAKYCIAIQETLAGNGNGVLSKATIEKMLDKDDNGWGLGPALLHENDSLLIGHGGKNAGFTNNMIAFARKGRAVIVMTNADRGGNLIEEIERSVSAYYDWGISEARTVETIELSQEELERLTGQFVLDFQVPDVGDYIINIKLENGQIVVEDPNNGEVNTLKPLEKSRFIDLSSGDEVAFSGAADSLEVLFNGQYRFQKVVQNTVKPDNK